MYILGYSGLKSAVNYKRRALEGLTEGEYRFAPGFDSAAALIHNGEVVAAVEEERFNGEKHTAEFPINAINYCLQEAGITMADVSHVCHGFNHGIVKPLFEINSFNRSYYKESLDPDLQIKILQSHWPDVDMAKRFVPI